MGNWVVMFNFPLLFHGLLKVSLINRRQKYIVKYNLDLNSSEGKPVHRTVCPFRRASQARDSETLRCTKFLVNGTVGLL